MYLLRHLYLKSLHLLQFHFPAVRAEHCSDPSPGEVLGVSAAAAVPAGARHPAVSPRLPHEVILTSYWSIVLLLASHWSGRSTLCPLSPG